MLKKSASLLFGWALGTVVLSWCVLAGGNTLQVLRNSIAVKTDGIEIQTDTFLYDDRTFVPLRDISEHLNCIVDWAEDSREVHIYSEYYDKQFPLDNAEFSYKGIALGMTCEQMTAEIGEPLYVGTIGIVDPETYYRYTYETFEIVICEGIIEGIILEHPSCETQKHVKIGDSRLKLIYNYGKPDSGDLEYDSLNRNYHVLYYYDKNRKRHLEFYFDQKACINRILIIGKGEWNR